MTATLNDVAKKTADEQSAEARAAVELVRLAKEQGLSTGPDGLHKQLTTTVLAPQIVRKRKGYLGGVEEVGLSLDAKGLTTGETSAYFAETCPSSRFAPRRAVGPSRTLNAGTSSSSTSRYTTRPTKG